MGVSMGNSIDLHALVQRGEKKTKNKKNKNKKQKTKKTTTKNKKTKKQKTKNKKNALTLAHIRD